MTNTQTVIDPNAAKAGFETHLAPAKPDDGELSWLPAWRLRELIGARKLSPVELTEHFLARIERLDPKLHAFRQVDAEGARAQAGRAEEAVMQGKPLGLLHGVPVATKEVQAIEGLSWRDNSVPHQTIAPRDSLEIERLRAAGAVLLGPTVSGLVVREFGTSDQMPLNPWNPERVCGDSSSGSACAGAAGMAPLNITVDGLGSTRLPAAFCGMIGLNPTRGLVASFDWGKLGTRPLSTTGPLARDVRDVATALTVLAGPDGRDQMCLPDDPPDYLSGLGAGAKGMRLMWSDDFGYAQDYAVTETPRVIETVRAAAFRLAEAGADIRATNQKFENPLWTANTILMSDPTIGVRVDPPGDVAAKVHESRQRIWAGMHKALAEADFILTPTILCVAPNREDWAERGIAPNFGGLYVTMTAVANLLGLPAISVPAGLVDGMPVGLQIIGRPRSEQRLLQLAEAFLALRG